ILASGSTTSRCGASSCKTASRVGRSVTPETTTAPSRSSHSTTLAGESLALTTGIDGIDKSSGVERASRHRPARVIYLSYQLAATDDTASVILTILASLLHRSVDRIDQCERARIDQQAVLH